MARLKIWPHGPLAMSASRVFKGGTTSADNARMVERGKALLGNWALGNWALIFVAAGLVVACTSETDSTTSSSPATSSPTSTSMSTEPTEPVGNVGASAFDAEAATWSRQVVVWEGSPRLDGWYRDISPHPNGFMAAGVEYDGVFQRPMRWLSTDGGGWMALPMPEDLEGRFTAVANDGEITVYVGYDTADQTGLVMWVPRGSDPFEVEFDDPVEFLELVATDSGFVAYGLADPTSENPRPALYTSIDGSSWDYVDVLPLGSVAEVVLGPDSFLLEIEDPGLGLTIRIRHAPSLFGENPEESYSWDVELPTATDFGFSYAMTAVATERGFLIGGGDAVSGEPMLWQVDLPEEQGPLTADLVEFEAPTDSRLFGDLIDIRHLTRSENKLFAIVSAWDGSTEAWSATDSGSWLFEETIGVHPTSNRYASAQSITGGVGAPGIPLTLVVTDGGFPSDLWVVGDEITSRSDGDLVAYQQQIFPLFIGSVDGAHFARVVEHAPRWSQTDPDVVRSRLFSQEEASWRELGATAWDRGSMIQSVVELESRAAAFGTATGQRGDITNEVYPITEEGLGEPTALEGSNGLELFDAVATTRAAVVVAGDTLGTGNRIVVWNSQDLVQWQHMRLEETVGSYIGAVCTGIDRTWILGYQGNGMFSSARAWSSVDGATWAGSIPTVPGSDTPTGFTACAGDEDRIVAAAAPGQSLMASSDGLSWESIQPPPALLIGDQIVEVAVDGERIGIIVQHPMEYFQPRHTPWLWDGDTWHQLQPEPGVEIASIALGNGGVHLAGASGDGSTIWQTTTG